MNEKLIREMVRNLLLEGPLEKMQNSGVPEELAKFIMGMMPKGCEAHAHWFAKQFKATLHQWDEQVAEYKKAIKQVKKIKKKHGFKSLRSEEDSSHERVIAYMDAVRLADKKSKAAITTLKRVLEPMKSSVELICKWATEKNVDLSKKKTAQIDRGRTDERGRQVMDKVPFTLAMAEEMASQHFGIQKGTVFMKFPNGWHWLDREVNFCSMEAQLMGHCGRTDDNEATLWSLRDERGMPQITVEIKSTDEGRKITQVMSKHNTEPDKELLPYVWKLLTNPELNLIRYTNSRWGGLKWDAIPEEVKEKIKSIHPDFEEGAEKSLEEAIEESQEQLTDALNEVERSNPLQNISTAYDLYDTDYDSAQQELDEYGSVSSMATWTASATIEVDAYLSDSVVKGLSEHLESYVSVAEGMELVNNSRYGSGIDVRWLDYDTGGGSEYEYQEFLEWLKSGYDDNWDKIVEATHIYLVANDEMDIEALGEDVDIGWLREILVLDTEFDHQISGNRIHLDSSVVADTENKMPRLPSGVTKPIEESILIAFGDDYPEELAAIENDPHNYIEDFNISVGTRRGNRSIVCGASIEFYYMEDGKIPEELFRPLVVFMQWFDRNEERIENIIRDGVGETEDPYALDNVPTDYSHVEEALKHYGHNDIADRWKNQYSYGSGNLKLTLRNFIPQVYQDILNGYRLVEYVRDLPGYSHSGQEIPIGLPKPSGKTKNTLGQYIETIVKTITPYDDLIKAVESKVGRPIPVGWHAENLWKKLPYGEEQAPDVQEESLRRMVRHLMSS